MIKHCASELLRSVRAMLLCFTPPVQLLLLASTRRFVLCNPQPLAVLPSLLQLPRFHLVPAGPGVTLMLLALDFAGGRSTGKPQSH